MTFVEGYHPGAPAEKVQIDHEAERLERVKRLDGEKKQKLIEDITRLNSQLVLGLEKPLEDMTIMELTVFREDINHILRNKFREF